MSVKVDEARRDDQACGVDHPCTIQRVNRDGRNSAVFDSEVTYPVQVGFWINDAAAVDDDIVLLPYRAPHATSSEEQQARSDGQ